MGILDTRHREDPALVRFYVVAPTGAETAAGAIPDHCRVRAPYRLPNNPLSHVHRMRQMGCPVTMGADGAA